MRSRQKKLFRARRKSSVREQRFRPATKGCARCENMLAHTFIEEGRRVKLPPSRCEHRGRGYLINGHLYMVLCICCVKSMMKRAPGIMVKEASG